MHTIKFRNEDYQKTKYNNYYYLLTKIHNNYWHQLKVLDSTERMYIDVCSEYIFNFGAGGGRREGILINYDV